MKIFLGIIGSFILLSRVVASQDGPNNPAGNGEELRAVLQRATNSGKPVRLNGTYLVSKDVTVFFAE